MSRPVALIVANVTHSIASNLRKQNAGMFSDLLKAMTEDEIADAVVRSILRTVATDAGMPVVLKALAAVGCPSSLEEATRAVQSARDRQDEEDGIRDRAQ